MILALACSMPDGSFPERPRLRFTRHWAQIRHFEGAFRLPRPPTKTETLPDCQHRLTEGLRVTGFRRAQDVPRCHLLIQGVSLELLRVKSTLRLRIGNRVDCVL